MRSPTLHNKYQHFINHSNNASMKPYISIGEILNMTLCLEHLFADQIIFIFHELMKCCNLLLFSPTIIESIRTVSVHLSEAGERDPLKVAYCIMDLQIYHPGRNMYNSQTLTLHPCLISLERCVLDLQAPVLANNHETLKEINGK